MSEYGVTANVEEEPEPVGDPNSARPTRTRRRGKFASNEEAAWNAADDWGEGWGEGWYEDTGGWGASKSSASGRGGGEAKSGSWGTPKGASKGKKGESKFAFLDDYQDEEAKGRRRRRR